jgi:hypothetical protein
LLSHDTRVVSAVIMTASSAQNPTRLPKLAVGSSLLVLAVSVLIGSHFRSYVTINEPCHLQKDLTISLPITVGSNKNKNEESSTTTPWKIDSMCNIFSQSYEEARYKLRNTVTLIQSAMSQNLDSSRYNPESLIYIDTIPVYKETGDSTDGNGAKEEYTMDIVVIAGNVPGLVVHVSGCHGVEGYSGSAIQIAFLNWLLQQHYHPKQSPMLSKMPTIVLVHAMNPYGMAKFRRVNENNVDLNRNALTKEQWETVANNEYNKQIYDKFDKNLFNPQIPQTASLQRVIFEVGVRTVLAFMRHGFRAIKHAMVSGQYHQPKGIFFGGQDRPEKSILVLQEWIQTTLLKSRAFLNDTTTATTWIDVHTGLGAPGKDTLLPSSKGEEWCSSEFQKWFPESHSEAATKDVHKGYENVQGKVINYFYELFFKHQPDSLLLVQEFGIVPAFLVGPAMIVENAALRNGIDTATVSKRTTKAVFYPETAAWRRDILENGLRVLFQAMERSSQLSSAMPEQEATTMTTKTTPESTETEKSEDAQVI